MTSIELSPATAARLRLLASAWETTDEGAVVRLIDRLTDEANRQTASPAVDDREIAVHAIYDGIRADGVYDRVTRTLTVTSGPGAGVTYRKPSGAAVAVVQAVNPSVNPNRNGWTFWTVSESGVNLQQIRREGERDGNQGVNTDE